MKTELKLQLQAYVDQEVSPGEARRIAALIGQDPEAKSLVQELKQTKQILAGNEMERQVPDSPEFYWSRIQQRIEAAEKAPSTSRSPVSFWLARIFAPLAGVAAIALFLLSNGEMNKATPTMAGLNEIETPNEDGSGFTFRSDTHKLTIVWISSQDQ